MWYLQKYMNNICVILYIGNALEEDIDSFISAGANIVLVKPLNVKLLEKVCNYWNKYGVVHHHHLLLNSNIISMNTIKDDQYINLKSLWNKYRYMTNYRLLLS